MQAEFGDQLIIVNQHQDDLFEIPWVVQRSELYGAGYMPHVRIDGKYAIRGAQNCSSAAAAYRDAIQQRLAQTDGLSPILVAGAFIVGADSVRLTATFTLLDPVTLPATRGFLLMLIDDMYWAGVYYDHVTQAACEQDLSLAQPGDATTMGAVFARDAAWEADDIHCLAFCQQMTDSLDVHQAAWLVEVSSWVPDDPRPIRADRPRASPNPFPPARGSLTLSLARPLAGRAVEILDSRGARVARIATAREMGAAGVLRWDGRDERGRPLPAGSYWIRLPDADADAGAGAGSATRLILVR